MIIGEWFYDNHKAPIYAIISIILPFKLFRSLDLQHTGAQSQKCP